MELGALELLSVTAVTMRAMALGLLLATANLKIIDYLAGPVRKRYPAADLWWLLYLALATGFCIAWFAPVNLFGELMPNVIVGRILTGILVGGGASLIHDVFDSAP